MMTMDSLQWTLSISSHFQVNIRLQMSSFVEDVITPKN
jgi:hypothetical protein